MIITSIKIIDEKLFKYSYSDLNVQIKQNETGVIFDDALDYIDSEFSYSETDIPLENSLPDYPDATFNDLDSQNLYENSSIASETVDFEEVVTNTEEQSENVNIETEESIISIVQ